MELAELIDKYRLNQSILAEKLGITRGAFSLKLRKKYDQYFSESQLKILKEFIDELIKDANSTNFS